MADWLKKLLQERVYVSYSRENDREYRDRLTAWGAQRHFDMDTHDDPTEGGVEDPDGAATRRALSRKVREADVVMVLVGVHTHVDPWVDFELRKAEELDKPVVGVRIRAGCPTPAAMEGPEVVWSQTFNLQSIKEALVHRKAR